MPLEVALRYQATRDAAVRIVNNGGRGGGRGGGGGGGGSGGGRGGRGRGAPIVGAAELNVQPAAGNGVLRGPPKNNNEMK